jgi:3',5'-cyclic AMP phosphodiesterase CpdA
VKALVIADLHLSEKPRDAYRFQVMADIANLIEKHKVDYLIILGDLTEAKDFHPATLVNAVVDIVHSFSQFCEVLVLRGNHDYTRADFPFFRFLRRLKRVRWINSVSRIDLGKADCLFLPHTRDYKKDWALLPHLEEIQFVFAHNTFEGSITEHGKKLSGIPTDMFEGNAPVISGDIHTPQRLGPVTYVGSPYTVDFGDSFEPRALLIDWFDHRDFVLKDIPLPGPQKRLLDITTADIGRLKKQNFEEGDIVKVRLTLGLEEQENWFALRDKVKHELSDLGADVYLVQPVTSAQAKSLAKIARKDVKSDEFIVQEYGKATKQPEATLQIGLSLLKEA